MNGKKTHTHPVSPTFEPDPKLNGFIIMAFFCLCFGVFIVYRHDDCCVSVQYNGGFLPDIILLSDAFCIIHVHCIPIVGVGKERHKNWSMVYLKRKHPLLELP